MSGLQVHVNSVKSLSSLNLRTLEYAKHPLLHFQCLQCVQFLAAKTPNKTLSAEICVLTPQLLPLSQFHSSSF